MIENARQVSDFRAKHKGASFEKQLDKKSKNNKLTGICGQYGLNIRHLNGRTEREFIF